MRILAVETSGARGGVALAEDQNVLEEVSLGEGLRHGRDLVLVAKEACARAGWDARRIDLVAVSIGPGSFTGIRIAVTLAKFLAWDTGAKVVAVPSFRALAANAPADRARVVTISDAKRGGLFASVFERRAAVLSTARPGGPAPGGNRGALPAEFDEVLGPVLIEPEDLARRLERPAYILGHGIVKARLALAEFDLAPKELWDIRPGIVAQLGAGQAARGEFADPLRLQPLYIRGPEAEKIWERRRRETP